MLRATKSEMTWKLQIKEKFFAEYAVEFDEKHIDFLVYPPQGTLFADAFLWAESKKEITDIPAMFAQLLLTIKKTVDAGEILPPNYLGVFDKERFACIEFHYVLPIFHRSDFNWNEKPSNVSDATVKIVEQFLTEEALLQFDFKNDEAELMKFIQINFAAGRECTSKIQITKNNFVTVFMKWSASVRPSIDFSYDDQRRYGLIDGDFYLGDLLSEDNLTLPDFKDLNVVLQHDYYKIKVKIAGAPRRLIEEISFRDGGKAHKLFWEKYQRPPKEEFRDYMKDRRDLLVPQDVRERKGSFFTPKIWVEKSQEYLEKVFGENWQDEYYIWDCCCGTGNLLAGLVNPHNVWASTIDQADIDILHTSISNKKCNLPEPHVFQFDFLNGNFNDLPEGLRNVINDTEKQKKLIIYINPPYGEGGNYTGRTKAGVSKNYSVNQELKPLIGRAANEMFALFFGHIRQSMPTANLAAFASVKYVNAYNFRKFRAFFKSRYRGGYICLANTFDNVQGGFPIGFLVWSFSSQKFPQKIQTDVFNPKGYHIGRKNFYSENQFINEWIDTVKCGGQTIGFLSCKLNELQYNQYVCICNTKGQLPYGCKSIPVTNESLIESCIYLAVRHSIGLVIPHKDKWICHNDPFLFPDKKFKRNVRFLNDCLIFALFHEKNKITSKDGINHWIPFSAKEVKAKDNFRSSFMPDYIKERGRFSKEAVTVLEAGKALWTYYHETIRNVCGATADASLYEIREYFKERNEQGRMNTKSADDQFNVLDKTLRDAVKALAKQIEPKVYEYGFLLQ